MRQKLFKFNKKLNAYVEHTVAARVLSAGGSHLLGGIITAVVIYVVYSLTFSSREEKSLIAENEYLQVHYDNLLERSLRVDDVIDGLLIRDKRIYNNIFNMDPPSTEGLLETGTEEDLDKYFSASEEELIVSSAQALENLDVIVRQVDRQIRVINDRLAADDFDPEKFPSTLPLDNFTLARTGATTGKKINPFYKTLTEHNGIDLTAPYGTEVHATASGVVVEVVKQERGLGNTVIIDHGNGLRTTYAHLSDVYVAISQRVSQGKVIGRVGNSGVAFTTSLHYEVRRSARAVDPVNYFFGSLSPAAYSDMLMIAHTTGQSLD